VRWRETLHFIAGVCGRGEQRRAATPVHLVADSVRASVTIASTARSCGVGNVDDLELEAPATRNAAGGKAQAIRETPP
jgi:hypothetical protein